MSDPRQDFELHLDGETWVIRFTNSALAHAEKLSGMTFQQLFVATVGKQLGFHTLACLTTAGLEGARRKLRLGGKPWTVDKVTDLLDGADTFDDVALPVIDAFQAALRRWFPPEEGDAEDPPTAAGTGTTSSEPPSAQG